MYHKKIEYTITKLLSITAMFLCAINFSYAQIENMQEGIFDKNAIYGSIGSAGLYFSATSYYERIITQNDKISSFVKAGYGGYSTWGGGAQYVIAQYGILTGSKKHHLEIGAGAGYFINEGPDLVDIPIAATIGWRIQSPRSNFIFRMGASLPEAIYIGIGFSF